MNHHVLKTASRQEVSKRRTQTHPKDIPNLCQLRKPKTETIKNQTNPEENGPASVLQGAETDEPPATVAWHTHLASSFPCFSIASLRSTSLAQKRHLLGGSSWQRWGSMCFSPVGRPGHHEYTVCVHGGGLDRLHLRHARCFLLLHSSATSSEHGGATGALHIRCI